MIEWSVEAAPDAVANQVAPGVFKLPVAIFIDYKLVTKTELTLTAAQIERLLFVRGLISASGSRDRHRREAAGTSPQGELTDGRS